MHLLPKAIADCSGRTDLHIGTPSRLTVYVSARHELLLQTCSYNLVAEENQC